LVTLIQQFSNMMDLEQIGDQNKAQPSSRFGQLLQGDAEFVDEIGTTFRRASFVVVGRCGGATPQKLPGHVSPEATLGQCLNDPSDTRSKSPQSFREFSMCHPSLLARPDVTGPSRAGNSKISMRAIGNRQLVISNL
jgi:hypothetical protein